VPIPRSLRPVVMAWVAGLFALAGPAEAQERQEVSIGGADTPVTVFADRIENLERDRLLVAEGRVEIEQGDVRLEADRVEVNTETGEAVATGKVVFFDGRDRLTGTRIEFNFRTGTGIVYQAQGVAEPHFFFAGDRMERFGEKSYRFLSGVMTTCEDETPAWSVHWGKATAYLDDYMWGTGASFWVWKIPVVPFIPIFGASLRRDRHSGFLTPTFGNSSTKGFSIRQPFYWAVSDNMDLTLIPAWFEKRGLGLGGAFRYVRTEASRGEVDGFFLHDTEKKEDRWVVGVRHEEVFTPRLNFKVDLGFVSDDQFFSEFGNTLDERSRQRLESNVSVTQRWNTWNFVGRLFLYEDLTTTQPIELQRLPELRLSAFQQPVPYVPGLLFELETSYTNFVRDIGSGGQRLDIRPRFFYPFSPGGFFTLTPRLGFRETVYDTKVIGTKVERGFFVEDTEDTFTNRSLLEAGMDVEARAYRVFDVGGWLGIQKLQHVIEPRLSWDYVVGDGNEGLPQWDALDTIKDSHFLTYSLTNRLKARAVGEGDKPGRVWELARLTLSQSYDVNGPRRIDTTSPGFGGRLSSVFADLILEPLFGIRFRATTNIDPYDGHVITATTDAEYRAQNWRVFVGTRHGQGGRLQFLQAAAEVRLGSHWYVRASSDYNVETETVVENRIEATFREQCWAITAAFINRVNEDEFHISINLLELGQWGFGRAFAGPSQ
jgi:LPS-assembly protein